MPIYNSIQDYLQSLDYYVFSFGDCINLVQINILIQFVNFQFPSKNFVTYSTFLITNYNFFDIFKYIRMILNNPQQIQKQLKQIKKSQIQQKKAFIGNIEDLPQYMKGYQMLRGYRINFNSYSQIFRSLFLFHNETVNIWSHLVGSMLMLSILIFSVLLYQTNSQLNTIQFQSYIQKYDPANFQCPAQALKILDEKLVSKYLQQEKGKIITNQTCNLYNKSYSDCFMCSIAANQINLIKKYVLQHFGQNLQKLQKIKVHWQKQMIPNIIHQIKEKSNFSAINSIKQKIQQIKKILDESQQNVSKNPNKDNQQNSQRLSRFPLYIFLFSAMFALLCSASFHLFNAMSPKAYKISIGLDFAGINIFISGAFIPAFYYGMYCYIDVAYFYMGIIMIIGISLFALSLTQWFSLTQQTTFRAISFAGFGAFYMMPVGHLIINQVFFNNYGDKFSFLPSFYLYLIGSLITCISALIYAKRCPQRKNPGKYDLCGHSHHFWHILIFIAMVFFYLGALENYHSRKQFQCPYKSKF